MTAEIPFCGFVAGQIMLVDVRIVNESSVKVYHVMVELFRVCLFKGDFSTTKSGPQLLLKGTNEGVSFRVK